MRKRIASLFLVLALCLSLLPTAALAEEIPETTPGDTIPANESTQEPEVDEAVEAVRSAIDALPAAEDWADLTAEEQEAAAEDASMAYEAYDDLTEEQQVSLSDELEKLIALFDKINSEVAPLELSGSGTASNPYIVSSAAEWATVCGKNRYGNLTAHIKLSNNIDLSATEFYSANLKGSLDGDGYTISGLTQSLFSSLSETTVIKNLAVVGADITGGSLKNVGILANSASGTITIQNCYVSGSVTDSYSGVGGLIGMAGATTVIKNCAADVTVKNTQTGGSIFGAGGLVGCVNSSGLEISNCYVTGTSITSARGAGGLVGASQGGTSRTITIQNSVALQSEVSSGNNKSYEGRLAGGSYFAGSTFTDDYAYTDMKGAMQDGQKYTAGGINGENVSKENCTQASFWSDLGFAPSVWTIEDGKLPRLTNLSAMTGNPPTYLLDAASCPVGLGEDQTVDVTFQTTDADTAEKTDSITITNSGSDTLAFDDFMLSSSNSASVPITGLRVSDLEGDTLTITMAKSVTVEKAYLFYRAYCLGEITLSKTVNKVALPVPTNAKWDTTVPGKATWTNVDNAANYSVQLYKDDAAQGTAVKTAENSYDFTSVIADTGSYTFKVKVLGDATYSESAEATSNAYAFTQQTLANVKISAVAALAAMSVSNETTADEVLNVVQGRITNKKIHATWSDGESGFKLTPASDGTDPGTDGHITGKIVLTLDSTQETITVNLTIQPKFAVTFASGNTSAAGTAPTQETVTADTQITLPANPYTYYGMNFTGWSDGTHTYQASSFYTMPAHNVTFTAQWTNDVWDGEAKSNSLKGSGTVEDPYIIASGADLNYLSNWNGRYCDRYYKLMADIDMGGHEMLPIYRLTGTFDGNGHKITNLKIESSDVYYGLFKDAGNNGTAAVIKNLTLENAAINDTKSTDSGKLGLLVSRAGDYLTIEDCYVTGSITTASKPYMDVGGLVGQEAKGANVTISRCYAGVTFKGGHDNSFFGGLVGRCESGIIENCYAIPDMTGVTAGSRGGITSSTGGTIQNCYAAGAAFSGAGIAGNAANISGSVSIFPEMRGSARIFSSSSSCIASNNYGFDGTIQRDSNGIVTPPAAQFAADKAQGANATAVQLKSFDFYKNTLGWSEDVWEIRSGYDFPVLKGQKAVPTLALNLTPSVVSVTLDKNSATLPCVSTLQLTATVDVKNGGSQTVQWHSSDLSKAVVDGNGKVTIPANAASGEVKITATATADASKIAVCTVTVDADSHTLTSQKASDNSQNSPNAVCTFYASAEDAQNETNPIDIRTTTVKAGTTVFARITNMTDEDVANHVLVNGKEATRLNGSTFSFTMPCENATAVFSCAVNLNAYNYVWFVGIDWGTWGETVTYTTTEWSGSDHIGSLKINGIINGKLFDSFDLKSMTGYDRTTKEENRVSLTKKNSKTDLTVPGDYFVDTTDTAHPVLYVYNDKPGTIMVNISLKDDPNATYNITKEAASTGYYTLDKATAKAGETVTATLTDAGIKAIGTNQSMTLDYYGGLLVVMFPGQFQKNENGNWTASFKMPAQDITTRVYVSSKLEVTLTGENKTVEYNGQPQTIDSAIKAKLGDVEASEAMWGHYEVTYRNGDTTSTTAPTDAGTYECTVKIADSDTLYYSDQITVTLTIKKATLTKVPAAPTAQSVTKHSITLNRPATFADGSAMSDSYALEYKRGENGTWQGSLTFTGLDAATTYTFYARIKESKNTNASGSSAGADITTADKDTVTFTLPEADQTFTYDKTGKTPGTATASVEGIQLEVQYTGTSTNGTAYNSTEAPVNAGSYQVVYKVPDSNADYQGTSAAVAFTIGKRTITVKADDKSMTVGGTLPEFTVSYGNLASGDSAETVFTTLATATTTADGKTTGSFEITVTTPTLTAEASNNYEVAAPEKGTLTVSQRSSSGGGSTTYPVNTPNETENGTVTVSPKNASKGSTVTITVKPDSGYQLDDLTVTDKNGKELKLTDKGNGKYTFTMPASKVEVNATFVKEVETSPFSDVSTSAYYYEAVKWAQEKGITGGIGNGLFGPNQPCTRAQIVTFLWRAAGSPEPKSMSSFSDVSADSYYAKAVAWAVENGITTGTGDGKFSPDATCTRAQSVTFLFRAIGKLVDSKAEFSDVLTDSYYANAVAWAVENGVTNGIGDGLFGPDNSCTRAQIVTFLFRAYQGK